MTEFGASSSGSGTDIFFRATDRLQMESCATAMAQEGKSLVISSNSAELLDYYGAAFIRRIKKELTQSSVEVFMPPDTEAMLDRFNKLLSTMKLDVATKPRGGLPPEKIWVVHDANALASHELDLLTRLILQFPGAGIGTVLMFTDESTKAENLVRQNKQFISWTLEMPTAEQKLNAIQQARKIGEEDTAIQFFNRLSKTVPKKPAFVSAAAAANEAPKKSSPPKAKQAKKGKSGAALLWSMIVASLLVLSMGVAAWLHPEIGDKAWAEISHLFDQGAASPKATNDAALSKGEEKIEPASSNVKLDEANNPMPTPGIPDSKTPVAGGADAAALMEAKPENKPEPKPELKPEPKVEAKPEKVITELPEIAVQGRLWLRGFPEDSFGLVHGTYDSVKQAQASMKGKAWLANARIVPVFAAGKEESKFSVVTGPFKTRDRAKNTITRLELSSDVTIQSAVNLNAQSKSPSAP
jgi:hypothetical protein